MFNKLSQHTRLLFALAGLGLASTAQAQTGEIVVPEAERSCDKPVEELAAAIRKNPESLLEEVAKSVGATPWCACPLVKTAIQAVGASNDQVGAIVYTATTVAPEQYKVIATCALEVAPNAAEEIRQALLKAFGENADAESGYPFGKGKEVAVKAIRVEQPATTALITQVQPQGVIDNVFIIPPAGYVSTPPNDTPPKSTPPKGTPPKGSPPSDPPKEKPPGDDPDPRSRPPVGTDSNPR